MKKSGLGKGLDVIFAENTSENTGMTLKLCEIEPNREQPRKDFKEEALNELADSISQHGILQPLLVRPILAGGYQIVAGERRWRAARKAGLTEVPVIIREMDDGEFMQLSLIENLQREDLSPLEEANGYAALMETHGFTQEEIGKAVGKSRPAVTNALRLLNLPESIQKLLSEGLISAGHARTLLGFKNSKDMEAAAKRIAEEGISVRELERLQKRLNEESAAVLPQHRVKNHYYEEAQLALNSYFGRKVTVDGSKKKGVLQIEFYGEDDLKELLREFVKEEIQEENA
ncbi:MAG: ParB/RepB/Spo0J family partition protein [Oscillospiraceae bacterium]